MTTVALTLSQAFDIALKFYCAGKLAEAEQVCLRILSGDADSVATLNLLAVSFEETDEIASNSLVSSSPLLSLLRRFKADIKMSGAEVKSCHRTTR